jgi:hypothetical protein
MTLTGALVRSTPEGQKVAKWAAWFRPQGAVAYAVSIGDHVAGRARERRGLTRASAAVTRGLR